MCHDHPHSHLIRTTVRIKKQMKEAWGKPNTNEVKNEIYKELMQVTEILGALDDGYKPRGTLINKFEGIFADINQHLDFLLTTKEMDLSQTEIQFTAEAWHSHRHWKDIQ